MKARHHPHTTRERGGEFIGVKSGEWCSRHHSPAPGTGHHTPVPQTVTPLARWQVRHVQPARERVVPRRAVGTGRKHHAAAYACETPAAPETRKGGQTTRRRRSKAPLHQDPEIGCILHASEETLLHEFLCFRVHYCFGAAINVHTCVPHSAHRPRAIVLSFFAFVMSTSTITRLLSHLQHLPVYWPSMCCSAFGSLVRNALRKKV